MEDLLEAWHRDHVNFAHLLRILERNVAAFHRGEHPNYELMGNIIAYLREFGASVHHRREDVAFARMVERAPDLEGLVDRLLQEHRVIAVAGEALGRQLEEAAGDAVCPRSALEAAAALYLAYYRSHLATEEREILPRAAQLLGPQDWAEVETAVPAAPEPLFGEDVHARFRELRRQIDREASIPIDV